MAPKVADNRPQVDQQEQRRILQDLKDNMFRACVVPAAYSIEEFVCGQCTFPEYRLRVIKLSEDEVGFGAFAMRNLSKHLLQAYFNPRPSFFQEIFGVPMSELKPDGLLCTRPWHDDTIAVMAPVKTAKLLVNALVREAVSSADKERLMWMGNVLLLSSSLQDKLGRAHATADVMAKWQLGEGLTLQQQFGWLGQLLQSPLQAPPPTATLSERLQFVLTGWKTQRCLQPVRHAYDRCPGYHIIQYRPNGSMPLFDARRPPLSRRRLQYSGIICKGSAAAAAAVGGGSGSGGSGDGGKARSGHYFSCANGAACDKSHSLVEVMFNPEHYKTRMCAACRGGKCVIADPVLPRTAPPIAGFA
eukprot:gene2289-2599_t